MSGPSAIWTNPIQFNPVFILKYSNIEIVDALNPMEEQQEQADASHVFRSLLKSSIPFPNVGMGPVKNILSVTVS